MSAASRRKDTPLEETRPASILGRGPRDVWVISRYAMTDPLAASAPQSPVDVLLQVTVLGDCGGQLWSGR